MCARIFLNNFFKWGPLLGRYVTRNIGNIFVVGMNIYEIKKKAVLIKYYLLILTGQLLTSKVNIKLSKTCKQISDNLT